MNLQVEVAPERGGPLLQNAVVDLHTEESRPNAVCGAPFQRLSDRSALSVHVDAVEVDCISEVGHVELGEINLDILCEIALGLVNGTDRPRIVPHLVPLKVLHLDRAVVDCLVVALWGLVVAASTSTHSHVELGRGIVESSLKRLVSDKAGQLAQIFSQPVAGDVSQPLVVESLPEEGSILDCVVVRRDWGLFGLAVCCPSHW